MINIIFSSRLILRKVNLEDASDMFEYASNTENIKYVEFEKHKSIEDTKLNIKNYFLKSSENKFAIVLKENNKMIGTIEFRINGNEANFGWIINKDYWSKGFCTEAAKELIKIYNEKYNISLFSALVMPENLASKRVLDKLGFKYKKNLIKKFTYEKYILKF
ncbi:GNAT family N-acetyltransferase [Spiroplasma endosymbiont of Cantharis rufa]|uniref:GNAT family N-acetyltransferase n=1 Tax=Spiroplasma endosymbiont of Cantharis rufa TaxID=3066279 RepID=UPI0030D31EB4